MTGWRWNFWLSNIAGGNKFAVADGIGVVYCQLSTVSTIYGKDLVFA